MLLYPFKSVNDLQLFLAQSSKQQFQETLPYLSLTELADSLLFLQSQPTLELQEKLEDLFKFIDSPSTLETLGKNFSLSLFIAFLDFLMRYSHYQNRLNFILVGLHPSVFSESLHYLQTDHLHILTREGLHEPLQYHLTQFIHKGENLRAEIESKAQEFKQEILLITPTELDQQTLQTLTHEIDKLRDPLIDYLEQASTALAIVWHTDRIDLIEKLSSINESIQHQLIQSIGHSTFDDLAPTGLYLFLEHTLSSIFDSLKDDDLAVEGLTQLAIWHTEDYWEMGLLPSIKHLDQLAITSLTSQEKEQPHDQQLAFLIQQQLEQLGIGKVKDLKAHHLFSQSLLKSYIHAHRNSEILHQKE